MHHILYEGGCAQELRWTWTWSSISSFLNILFSCVPMASAQSSQDLGNRQRREVSDWEMKYTAWRNNEPMNLEIQSSIELFAVLGLAVGSFYWNKVTWRNSDHVTVNIGVPHWIWSQDRRRKYYFARSLLLSMLVMLLSPAMKLAMNIR